MGAAVWCDGSKTRHAAWLPLPPPFRCSSYTASTLFPPVSSALGRNLNLRPKRTEGTAVWPPAASFQPGHQPASWSPAPQPGTLPRAVPWGRRVGHSRDPAQPAHEGQHSLQQSATPTGPGKPEMPGTSLTWPRAAPPTAASRQSSCAAFRQSVRPTHPPLHPANPRVSLPARRRAPSSVHHRGVRPPPRAASCQSLAPRSVFTRGTYGP